MNFNLLKYLLLFILFGIGTAMAQNVTITNYSTADGLPDNNVLDVAVDGNNVKWFATQGGVCRYNDTSWTVYTTANGLIDNYAKCITADQDNNIWVGTDMGVSRWNGSNWTSFTTSNGLPSEVISDIAVDTDNSIWIGTDNGLSHYDGATFTNYTTASGLAGNMISCLAVDDAGNKWIGTWLGGLSKLSGSTFTTFTTAQGLADNNISALATDDLGNKWVGTLYGTSVLNSADALTVTYTMNDGLYHNYVMDIVVDDNHNTWFGIFADYLFDGAVTRFTGTSWTSWSTPEGLADKMVNQLALEAGSIVWVATGNGASKMATTSGIAEVESNHTLKIFPNPAKDVVTLPNHKNTVEVSIYDLSGRLQIQTRLNAGSNNIAVSGLSAGMYYLHLTENDNTTSAKLLID
jgi:ligand-binding sensor domain-containing protein